MVAATTSATNTSSTNASALSSLGASSAADIQNQFLTMLVAQLKNQDPMNPMDNSQITTQLSQLSTLQGIQQLNTTLTAYTQSQSFQSVNMIGHNVLAPGSALSLSGGKAIGGVEVPSAVDQLQVNVTDASGAVVKTINLGSQSQGVVPFQWDGTTNSGQTAPDGSYSFTVSGSLSGKSVAVSGLSVGLVQSVLMDQSGPMLSVQGMGLVDLSQVKQIL
jgi:flagellar basal-body rod modification protein FlgD